MQQTKYMSDTFVILPAEVSGFGAIGSNEQLKESVFEQKNVSSK